MKTFIVFSAIIAVAVAGILPHISHHGSPADEKKIVIVKETPSNNIGLDSYQFAYEQSDGQKREESAQIETRRNVKEDEDESILRVSGSFSWVNPEDGQVYTVSYIADENGFQPQGAHLPVAPVA